MTIKEFEKEIQSLFSPKLRIKQTQPDLCGVFFGNEYIGVALPPYHIYDGFNEQYKDRYGHMHRTRGVAKNKIIRNLRTRRWRRYLNR